MLGAQEISNPHWINGGVSRRVGSAQPQISGILDTNRHVDRPDSGRGPGRAAGPAYGSRCT